MIERISIRGVASYSDDNEQIIEPKKVNFLFGLNGSGKTTISRYLAAQNDQRYSKCQIEDRDSNIKYCVYNQDYVKENFSAAMIPGVFTLGKDSIETKTKREKLTNEIEKLNEVITQKTKEIIGSDDSLGYQQKLAQLEQKYTDKFWEIKQAFSQNNSHLKEAISGVLTNKIKFKDRLLSESQKKESVLLEKEQLESRCQQLFGASVEKVNPISVPSGFDDLLSLEKNEILKIPIVGKENVAISELIQKLGNSAWFSSGRQYLDLSNGKCPFCQQKLPDDFPQQVANYFDETYKKNIGKISSLKETYINSAKKLIIQIQPLIDNPNIFLKADLLIDKFDLLKERLKSNLERIKNKETTPNSIVELDSIEEISTSIKSVIQKANNDIREHNARIDNIKDERAKLTSEVWRFIVSKLESDINDYNRIKLEIQQKIDDTNKEIEDAKTTRNIKTAELHEIEKRLTSITPTANGINDMLKNYGFNSFKLKENDETQTYRFVRTNNEPAFETLSEGERNFVTFLYFMHTLKGNTDNSGRKDNKVLVIDDPVSSLDSDVLFLVSSLIRDLFDGVYHNNSRDGVKQIFILSHNLYFFKEVSYELGIEPEKTGYWIVSKVNNVSKIKSYNSNPVSSTYEMLWDEVRRAQNDPTNFNTVTLANAMRRILEYYFHFLGRKSLNSFHRQFPDGERQLFKSLISWTMAGSHSQFDDFSSAPSTYNAQSFLTVFKKLFEITNNLSHYNMMMHIKDTSNPTEQTNG